MKYISPIAIDMGGKNTGLFSFTAQNFSDVKNSQVATLVYNKSFVLSQETRRAKRHTKRNDDRKKFAKRLFLLILIKHYDLSIDTLPDVILGLFNKRGYTYASFELKDDDREKLESDTLRDFLTEHIETYPIEHDSIEAFLNAIASNKNEFKIYKEHFDTLFEENTIKNKRLELKTEVKERYKENHKELFDGLKIVKEILNEFDKQENQGNLPREKYFDEIAKEIENNQAVKAFFETHNLAIKSMQKLICNISNFQLKELRRYFNDEAMKTGDIWVDAKLHRVLVRFVKSWHPKDEETRARRRDVLKALKETTALSLLETIDPIMTIPPYDDMNNRGAVKCQVLRLNEQTLDSELPNWREIAQKLATVAYHDSVSESTVKGWGKDSTLLHRILDTSSAIDPYALRSGKIEHYVDLLGKKDATELSRFALRYYDLIKKKVRTGIWSEADTLLKKCDHNPPYKANQLHNLVAEILGVKLDSDKFETFKETVWQSKIGAKKIVNYCKDIEELRKSHGNLFKVYTEEIKNKESKTLTSQEKKDKGLLDTKFLERVVEKISKFFEIEEKYQARFFNYFSMAQLYSIIETKTSGFNKTCKWCSLENQFRTTTHIEIDPESGEVITNANCQRLPSDTQRPFSGKIERYIDKLGYEIAKLKYKELEKLDAETIMIPIILEQNSFEYEESIRGAEIKNANKKSNDKLAKSKERYIKSIQSKEERIQAFNAICPYSGKEIGTQSEIDHILPRSMTRKKYGTIFNSEGNLIHTHIDGNQAKQETIYTLQDIHDAYKEEMFHTTNDEEIVRWIEEQILSIKGYKTFSILSPNQQKAFKNALFLPHYHDSYKQVVYWLRTEQSARVNGTQKYLAKKILTKLSTMLPNKNLEFEFVLVDAEDTSKRRKAYAKANPLLKKEKIQKASSHVIDAVIVYASQLDTPPSADAVVAWSHVEDWTALKYEVELKSISTNTKIAKMIKEDDFSPKRMQSLFSKSIFSENAIGERYSPIVVKEDKIYVGYPVQKKKTYDLEFCKEITNKKELERFKKIIEEQIYCTRTTNQDIKIYKVHKASLSEASNLFFNDDYTKLSAVEKEKALLVETIITNCQYYVKKISVIHAPKVVSKTEKQKYPFYHEWVRFDKAWKDEVGEGYKVKVKDKKAMYDIVKVESQWREFCQRYFKIEKRDNRYKARKVFSMIVNTTVSGTMLRLKRKTLQGESIYQAVPMDNNQIKKEYVKVLLKNAKKTIALAANKPSAILKKELVVVEDKDIRDIAISPQKFFKECFAALEVEVIVNKTSVSVKKFPLKELDTFTNKSATLLLRYLRMKKKTSVELLSKAKQKEEYGIKKDAVDLVLKLSPRGDMNVSNIRVYESFVDFTLPFKSTKKLLDD